MASATQHREFAEAYQVGAEISNGVESKTSFALQSIAASLIRIGDLLEARNNDDRR